MVRLPPPSPSARASSPPGSPAGQRSRRGGLPPRPGRRPPRGAPRGPAVGGVAPPAPPGGGPPEEPLLEEGAEDLPGQGRGPVRGERGGGEQHGDAGAGGAARSPGPPGR